MKGILTYLFLQLIDKTSASELTGSDMHLKKHSDMLPSYLILRILASFMMSILSYLLFDGLFSAYLFYGASGLPTWIVIVSIIFFRAGYAELVSDNIMGIRHQLSLINLIIASLVYGLPFFTIADRLNLTPIVIPILKWFDGIMINFQLQNWSSFVLGLAFGALLIDFPRLVLFIIVTPSEDELRE